MVTLPDRLEPVEGEVIEIVGADAATAISERNGRSKLKLTKRVLTVRNLNTSAGISLTFQ